MIIAVILGLAGAVVLGWSVTLLYRSRPYQAGPCAITGPGQRLVLA